MNDLPEQKEKEFEILCRNHPEIESLRIEAEKLAVQFAGDRETLRICWFGKDGTPGLKHRIGLALEPICLPDQAKLYHTLNACCRALWQELHSQTPWP